MHAQARVDHVQRPVAHAAAADRVVDGVGVPADEGLDLGVAARPGRLLAPAATRQRRLLQELAHEPEAAHQAPQVALLLQEGRVDQRRRQRIAAGQAHAAAALRPQHADVAGKAVPEHRGAAVVDQLADHEVQLQVGHGLGRVAPEKAAGLGEVAGQRPAPLLAPAPDVAHRAPGTGRRQAEQLVRAGHVPDLHHVRVVVQVHADARQLVLHRDAVLAQVVGRADAREHQQLWRLEAARRQDHFALDAQRLLLTVLQIGDADGAVVLEQHARGVRAGQHAQVRTRPVGRQIGAGGRAALAAPMRDLVQAHALLHGAVEVPVVGVAGLHPGLDEGLGKRVRIAQVHHVQRSARAVPGIGTALVVLRALEERQHLVPAPADVALGGPGVVVARHAAHVDHGVHRARAAQYLAARLVAAPAAQARLRHGLEAPVGAPELRQQRQAGRAVDQHAVVGRARFQQRHLHLGVLRQARCQHAAGRASAHDHVVHPGVSCRVGNGR